MAAIQRDPSLQALLFGGGMPQSTLGSLGQAPGSGGPPGAAPITQQPAHAGQPRAQVPAIRTSAASPTYHRQRGTDSADVMGRPCPQ